MNHIGHFIESVNQLLLKLRYPSGYPPLTDLYIPQYVPNEDSWLKQYLNLLVDLFPKNFTPALHLAYSFNLFSELCFRSAVRSIILLFLA